MKTHHQYPLLLALALVMAIVIPVVAVAQEKIVRTAEKRFDVSSSPSVHVEGRFGPITVTATERNSVEVSVEISAEEETALEAKRLAERVSVEIEGSSSEVRVKVDLPSQQRSGSDKHSLQTAIRVTVPKRTVLSVKNAFGSIVVTGIDGSARIRGEFGLVEMTQCANVEVENSFGNITLNAIRGALKVEGKNGKIRVYDFDGGDVRNAFGEIDVANARGAVTILGRMGSITAKGIPGGQVQNSYGATHITMSKDFSGTIEAMTRFGDIESDFPLEARNPTKGKQYGPTQEDRIGKIGSGTAHLRVINEFGEITLRKK